MKGFRVFALLLALALPATAVFASQGFDAVVTLINNGVSNDVIRAYIDAHPDSFQDLSAGEIVYLNDMGVPQDLIADMLSSGGNAATEVSYEENAAPAANETVDQATITAPEQQPDMSYFYEALSPYGKWQQDATYGWVWQPAVAVRDSGWRPYLNAGHWVWSDQGWFWQSDYSWGWCPFHYGRWTYTSSWVWVPGNVWGPAWVDWRVGDNFYGWAPLPPAARFEPGVGFLYNGRNVGFAVNFDFGLRPDYFTFVSAAGFLAPNLTVNLLDWRRHDDYFRRSRVVNHYYVSGRAIVNAGIPIDRVRRDTRRDIRPVRIASADVRPGEPVPPTYRSGNELVAFRPSVRDTASLAPPAAVARYQARAQERAQRVAASEARRTERTANREANPAQRQRARIAEQIRRQSLAEGRQATRETNRAANQARRSETSARRSAEQLNRQQERANTAAERQQQQAQRQTERQQQRKATQAQRQQAEQQQRQQAEQRRQSEAQQRQELQAQRQQQQEQSRQQQLQEQQQRRAQQAQRQQEMQQQQQEAQQRRAQQVQQRQQEQQQRQEQLRAQQQEQQQRQQAEQQQRVEQQAQRQQETEARQAQRAQQTEQRRAEQVQQREARQTERQEAVRTRQDERQR